MPRLFAPTWRLPPEDAITARSRKFYDGTYTWDTSGFTDESGVYREFDCVDPEARAPTPLPPVFDAEDGDVRMREEEEGEREELSGELERELFGTGTPMQSHAQSQGGEEDQQEVVAGSGTTKTLDDADYLQFASRDDSVLVKKAEMFVGRKDRDRLVAEAQGVLLACQHLGKDLSLEECYDLCRTEVSAVKSREGEDVPSLTKQEERDDGVQAEQNTVDVLRKPVIAAKTTTLHEEKCSPLTEPKGKDDRRTSTDSSGLSDVPSNLSGQSPSNQNTSTPPNKASTCQKQDETEGSDGSEDEYKPPRRKVTRGVAQKVRKSTRKVSATKTKPAKKTEASTSLAALHAGTYRRSARQEAKLGTKR